MALLALFAYYVRELILFSDYFNPRPACTARITVVVVCV